MLSRWFGEKTPKTDESARADAAPPAEQKSSTSLPVAKPLGQILLEEGLITPHTLAEALAIQEKEGGFLGQILVSRGYLKESDLISCIVRQCKVPHLSLLDYDIRPEVLRWIPEEICKRYCVLPIDKLGRILTVAMVDPLDEEALAAIRNACPELRVKPILCNWEHFQIVSRRLFSREKNTTTENTLTLERLGLKSRVPQQRQPETGLPSERLPVEQSLEDRPSPSSLSDSKDTAHADAPAIHEVKREEQTTSRRRPAAIPTISETGSSVSSSSEVPSERVGAVEADTQPSGMHTGGRDTATHGKYEIPEAAPQTPAPGQPALPLDPQWIGTLVKQAVGEAVQQVIRNLSQELQNVVAPLQTPAAAASSTPEQVREIVREAIEAASYTKNKGRDDLTQAITDLRESIQHMVSLTEEQVVARNVREDLQRQKENAAAFVSAYAFGASASPDNAEFWEGEVPLESYTLEHFYAGKNNGFALEIARSVVQEPGEEYNPFFVYGHVGVGKTHLLCAIGNAVKTRFPHLSVGYINASLFAKKCEEAEKNARMEDLRRSFGRWDVLIVDDVQFLGGRVEAQEEFFHVFNALHQKHKQILIAGDKPPDRLGLMEQRLISRFASGIVVELKPPDWETRRAILLQFCKDHSLHIPEPVLGLIATRVTADVRKMLGCAKKVGAYAKMQREELTCETAAEILNHLGIEDAA